ncbi:MAG: efflux RND transporter permease subunit [Candidatus Binatia bacterium]
MSRSALRRGPVSWMAQNPVAANLLMVVILVGGLIAMTRVKVETFPEFEVDVVTVEVPYPGASPEEVEKGILLAIEEEVLGLDGVDRVTARAFEGRGLVMVELLLGTDRNKALQDIKNGVDRLTSFPEEAERPVVSLISTRQQVLSLVVYGDLGERTLRALAEQVRDEMLQDPRITMIELYGVPPPEISIEVPQAKLRAHDLTLESIADLVRRSSLELPGGGVKTSGGEVLLRTQERRDYGREFADVRLLSTPDGAEVKVGEIATIADGFADTEQHTFYDGKPAIRIDVFRVGDQTPMGVAHAAKENVERIRNKLPEGAGLAIWLDMSEFLQDRISLLTRNAFFGLVLVVLVLGLLLEPRLAGWVTMGIPVSICGAFLLMPLFDVSINMVSLMAFILTIGIVVDDAIVIGESVYEERKHGAEPMDAAIRGARLVGMPVVFSVLTNMVTFVPLLLMPGPIGKIFMVVPIVVITIFSFSLIESLFILPAHLGHLGPMPQAGLLARLERIQDRFATAVERFHDERYGPVLRASLQHRYLTTAIGATILILTIGYVAGGRIDFSFMPRIDSDVVMGSVVLPYGSPVEETERIQERMLAEARAIISERGGERVLRGISSWIGTPAQGLGPQPNVPALTGGHLGTVAAYFVPTDQRPFTASEFAREWRTRLGEIAGIESLTFIYSTGPTGGSPIDVELSHPDRRMLEAAGQRLAGELATYAGVSDIDDGVLLGKPQLDFRLTPAGRSAGLTAAELARQVRNAFYGAEALRQQRGRDEMKVMVRFPRADRKSVWNVEELILRAPDGGEIPLAEAATVERGRAYTEIRRANGRRVINVTADVDDQVGNAAKILEDTKTRVLPELSREFPGVRFGFEGEQRERARAMRGLGVGFILALIAIFALIAMPFRSYVQPLIIMTAIPFGIVGAVVGHVIMGYELSTISMMGIVALSGVVVNDSLVLIDAANQRRAEGMSAFEAIDSAALRRFRPILLTSATTFVGLVPMLLEPSMQARFLIPMAISLAFGILFSTALVLLIVPSLYLIVEDLRHAAHIAPAVEETPEGEAAA